MKTITYTPDQLADVTQGEAFELSTDFTGVAVIFQNGIASIDSPFTVTLDPEGVTITVHDDYHGPFQILSPRYNNLYMHNLESVTFHD